MIVNARPLSLEETRISETILGGRIKGWRLVRGLSYEELSDLTGVPVAVLKTYEQGRRTPGGLRMLLIMNALRLTPADLLHIEDTASANERKS